MWTQPLARSLPLSTPPPPSNAILMEDSRSHYFYSRIDNPNRKSLEECLADLEGGVEAVCFSTGMAASLAVFQALAPGDHVVLHRDLYFGVRELVTGLFSRWGLKHSFVDMRNIEEIRKACRPETTLSLAGDADQSPD